MKVGGAWGVATLPVAPSSPFGPIRFSARGWDRRGSLALLALLTLLIGACGRIDPTPGVPSSPTAQQSPTPTPSSSPAAFQPGDCTYATTGGTPAQPASDTFQTVISIPAGWSPKDTSQSDTTDFLMSAPASYMYQPTTMSVSAPLPTDPGQTPSTFLDRIAQGTVSVVASSQPCTVGNDPAAFLSFTSGSTIGYIILWFHFGDAYVAQLKGNGGVDQRAVQDAKGVLASVSYNHNVPPPGYSPSPITWLSMRCAGGNESRSCRSTSAIPARSVPGRPSNWFATQAAARCRRCSDKSWPLSSDEHWMG